MSRIAVLCQCGWGNLAMEESEIPANCPLCGFEFKEPVEGMISLHLEEEPTSSFVPKLRKFTSADWEAFAGCDSAEPRIGERGPDIVIVDGKQVSWIHTPPAGSGPDEILAAFAPLEEYAQLLGEVLLDLHDELRESFARSCMKKVN